MSGEQAEAASATTVLGAAPTQVELDLATGRRRPGY
jgi:hypothetical protein